MDFAYARREDLGADSSYSDEWVRVLVLRTKADPRQVGTDIALVAFPEDPSDPLSVVEIHTDDLVDAQVYRFGYTDENETAFYPIAGGEVLFR